MEKNEMTPEKSLQIISEAIARSRKDFEKSAGTPLIIWGTTVLFFSLIIWLLLKESGDARWNYLWFGIPAIGLPISRIVLKGREKNEPENFISSTLAHIWITYGIFATTLAATFVLITPQQTSSIGILTAALMGFAAVMTGMVLKNRIIIVGGFIIGIGCTVALFFMDGWDSSLLFAAAAVINLIVPGAIMNKKAK